MGDLEYPKLRPVEAFPVKIQGTDMVVLRDPLRLRSDNVCVSMQAAFLLNFFDGKHSLLEIKAEYTRRTGALLFSEQLDELVAQLDEHALLETETFRKAYEKVQNEFVSSGVRPAFHAGTAYPEDPRELALLLDGFYPPSQGEDAAAGYVRALMVPHIDVRSGGPTFARGYRVLARSTPLPEVFVILGTGHQGLRNLFAVTRKTFMTPFGPVETDTAFVDRLVEGLPASLLQEEIAHRTEHVIEFQVIFLQHLFGARHTFRIVPLLCSFGPELFSEDHSEERALRFDPVAERLRSLIESWEKPVCVIASVDLDHVGPRYGDPFSPDQTVVARYIEEDRALLEMILDGEKEAFLRQVMRDNARKKICGFPPLYTLLTCLPGLRGEVLDLTHCRVDEQGSFVSYAAAVFRDP